MTLRQGIYECNMTKEYYNSKHEIESRSLGTITLSVKETEKSYMFNLISNTVRYDSPQIDDMFRDNKRVIIRKDKPTKHAMRKWKDYSFTLYPYQAGVPYIFYFVKEN